MLSSCVGWDLFLKTIKTSIGQFIQCIDKCKWKGDCLLSESESWEGPAGVSGHGIFLDLPHTFI